MPVESLDQIPFLEEYNIGQLGHGDTFMRTVPLLIKTLAGVKIVKISCGDWHTAAVSDSGDLFTWGENTNGRLGLPIDIAFSTSPKKLGQDKIGRIVQVACGMDFTCVLNRNGEVFGFGSGTCGQLGNGASADSWEPVKATGLEQVQVSKIACGKGHVIALAVVGTSPLTLKELASRYITRNLSSLRNKLKRVPVDVIPILEQQLEKQLSQNYQHELYAWGLAERGQLGVGEFVTASALRKQLGFMKMRQQYLHGFFFNTPQKVQTENFPPNFQVKDIQCGYYHSLCLLDDGSVFSWGEGSAGQTGLGHLESKDSPQPVTLPEGKWIAKKIAAKFLITDIVAADYTNFKLLEGTLQKTQQPESTQNDNNANSDFLYV